MLTREAKPYVLQYLKEIKDDYGYLTNEWARKCIIDVAINEVYKQTADAEGAVYMRRTLQGVTKSTCLVSGLKYRIVGEKTFEVIDFINGRRLTQLQLREVV